MARSKQGISVSQQKYALDLLSEIGMSGCRLIDTLMNPNTKLKPRNEETTSGETYLLNIHSTRY